jgi:YbgC/YbaW family acyl-CoA thioester hydrolase
VTSSTGAPGPARPASIEVRRRVEWADTDAAGHHHNTAVLRWLEEAETVLHERLGIVEQTFGRTPRVRLEIDFTERLYFRDIVSIRLAVAAVGRTSLTYSFEVARGEVVAARGRLIIVNAAAGEGAQPWAAELRQALAEAGPQPGEYLAEQQADGIDTSVAHPARVYDYWLGGTNNFPADREAAERVLAATPGLRFRVRANRAFLARAVRYLAGEAGIGQFLDIGTGIPSADNTHQVAQAVAPDARVVYADNDPIVLTHARALLAGDPRGATQYVAGDLRDPAPILAAAAQTLDLGQPAALMLLGVLHLIQDDEDPYRIVAGLMDALAPGSYLVLSHPASDIHPGQAEAQRRYNELVATPQTLRSRAEVSRFFDGLDLVPPGLVYVHDWRPGPQDAAPPGTASAYGGVARKR